MLQMQPSTPSPPQMRLASSNNNNNNNDRSPFSAAAPPPTEARPFPSPRQQRRDHHASSLSLFSAAKKPRLRQRGEEEEEEEEQDQYQYHFDPNQEHGGEGNNITTPTIMLNKHNSTTGAINNHPLASNPAIIQRVLAFVSKATPQLRMLAVSTAHVNTAFYSVVTGCCSSSTTTTINLKQQEQQQQQTRDSNNFVSSSLSSSSSFFARLMWHQICQRQSDRRRAQWLLICSWHGCTNLVRAMLAAQVGYLPGGTIALVGHDDIRKRYLDCKSPVEAAVRMRHFELAKFLVSSSSSSLKNQQQQQQQQQHVINHSTLVSNAASVFPLVIHSGDLDCVKTFVKLGVQVKDAHVADAVWWGRVNIVEWFLAHHRRNVLQQQPTTTTTRNGISNDNDDNTSPPSSSATRNIKLNLDYRGGISGSPSNCATTVGQTHLHKALLKHEAPVCCGLVRALLGVGEVGGASGCGSPVGAPASSSTNNNNNNNRVLSPQKHHQGGEYVGGDVALVLPPSSSQLQQQQLREEEELPHSLLGLSQLIGGSSDGALPQQGQQGHQQHHQQASLLQQQQQSAAARTTAASFSSTMILNKEQQQQQLGAQPDLADFIDGRTPIHLAAQKGCNHCLELLLLCCCCYCGGAAPSSSCCCPTTKIVRAAAATSATITTTTRAATDHHEHQQQQQQQIPTVIRSRIPTFEELQRVQSPYFLPELLKRAAALRCDAISALDPSLIDETISKTAEKHEASHSRVVAPTCKVDFGGGGIRSFSSSAQQLPNNNNNNNDCVFMNFSQHSGWFRRRSNTTTNHNNNFTQQMNSQRMEGDNAAAVRASIVATSSQQQQQQNGNSDDALRTVFFSIGEYVDDGTASMSEAVDAATKSGGDTALHLAIGGLHDLGKIHHQEEGGKKDDHDFDNDDDDDVSRRFGSPPSSRCACVRTLIASGASANIRNKQGLLPLHLAAKTGCVYCVQMLLKDRRHMATVAALAHLGGQQDVSSSTTTMEDATLAIMMPPPPQQQQQQEDEPPVSVSSQQDGGRGNKTTTTTTRKLHRRHSHHSSYSSSSSSAVHHSPLTLAAQFGHWDVVRVLVEDFGANVEHKCKRRLGLDTMHFAITKQHAPTVELLLRHGFNPRLERYNYKGMSALELAAALCVERHVQKIQQQQQQQGSNSNRSSKSKSNNNNNSNNNIYENNERQRQQQQKLLHHLRRLLESCAADSAEIVRQVTILMEGGLLEEDKIVNLLSNPAAVPKSTKIPFGMCVAPSS